MESINAFVIMNDKSAPLRWNASGNIYVFNSSEEAHDRNDALGINGTVLSIDECSQEIIAEYNKIIDKEI